MEFSVILFIVGITLIAASTISINTLSAVLRGRRELKDNPVTGSHGYPVVHGITRTEPGKQGVTDGQTISRCFLRATQK